MVALSAPKREPRLVRAGFFPQRYFRLKVLAVFPLLAACSGQGDEPPNSDSSAVGYSAINSLLDEKWEALQARYPSATRPDVEIVRIVTANEWASAISQCLIDEGFPYVEAKPDGGVQWLDVPTAQMQGFDIARFTCSAMYPRDPSHQEPLTEAQLDWLYNYYTGEMTECLTELGYDVPPPPSAQAFRETYYTDHPWLPFSDAYRQVQSQKEYDTLATTCPQAPDEIWQQ